MSCANAARQPRGGRSQCGTVLTRLQSQHSSGPTPFVVVVVVPAQRQQSSETDCLAATRPSFAFDPQLKVVVRVGRRPGTVRV